MYTSDIRRKRRRSTKTRRNPLSDAFHDYPINLEKINEFFSQRWSVEKYQNILDRSLLTIVNLQNEIFEDFGEAPTPDVEEFEQWNRLGEALNLLLLNGADPCFFDHSTGRSVKLIAEVPVIRARLNKKCKNTDDFRYASGELEDGGYSQARRHNISRLHDQGNINRIQENFNEGNLTLHMRDYLGFGRRM